MTMMERILRVMTMVGIRVGMIRIRVMYAQFLYIPFLFCWVLWMECDANECVLCSHLIS